MKAYCINLQRRKDRRKEATQTFEKTGMQPVFFDAIDGVNLPTKERFTPGMVGCWESHVELYQKIKETDELTLIAEDDVQIVDGFDDWIQNALLELQQIDWDIAFLGYNDTSSPNRVMHYFSPSWKDCNSCWGFHFYMVNGKKGANNLLRRLSQMHDQIDIQVLSHVYSGRIRGCFAVPSQASQSKSKSDVQITELL